MDNNEIMKIDSDTLKCMPETLIGRYLGEVKTFPTEYKDYLYGDLIRFDNIFYMFTSAQFVEIVPSTPDITVYIPEDNAIGINTNYDAIYEKPSISVTLKQYMITANITEEEMIKELRSYLEENHSLTICDKYGF